MTSSAPTSVIQRPFQPQVVSQVVSGWLAAESAFANAARTSDPDAPELAATTIDPQLTWSRSLLGRMGASGQIAKGPVQLRNAPRHRIAWGPGHRSDVRARCGDRHFRRFGTASAGNAGPGGLRTVHVHDAANARWMEVADTRGGCGSMRSTLRFAVAIASIIAGVAFPSLSAQASASGGDGPGGIIHVGASNGGSGGGGPGGGASGKGGGQSPSPWLCIYTELILNDGGGIAPGGPTPGSWYSVTCTNQITGASVTQTEWIPDQSATSIPAGQPLCGGSRG